MKEKKKIINKNILIKCIKRLILIIGIIISLFLTQITYIFATNDPLVVVNNLSTFIFSIVRAIGMILLGWGIVQIGLALKSHDPSQRANGFMTLARRNNNYFCKRDIRPNYRWLKIDKSLGLSIFREMKKVGRR